MLQILHLSEGQNDFKFFSASSPKSDAEIAQVAMMNFFLLNFLFIIYMFRAAYAYESMNVKDTSGMNLRTNTKV